MGWWCCCCSLPRWWWSRRRRRRASCVDLWHVQALSQTSSSLVVAICGCWFEEDCWWLCFRGQVGCDSMTSMSCIALLCITYHMMRIHRTELVLWISALDMLQQHCLPYEENLKSRASFVDLSTWHVAAALHALWRKLEEQSFFCGSLRLTCCSIACHMKRTQKVELILWISVPDMLQHCQREAEAPPLLLPTSRCLPAKNCGWFHFQDQVKDAIPWQCALPATWRELEELLVWIYDMSKHFQREAPPLLPFVGCLQPEEEEDCR